MMISLLKFKAYSKIRIFRHHFRWMSTETASVTESAENTMTKHENKKHSLELDKYREDISPFLKNLFVGIFDTKILNFPEVMDNERFYRIKKKCLSIQRLLEERRDIIRSIDHEEKISEDVLLALRCHGLYGMDIAPEFGGEGLSNTEIALMLEEFSVNMSLSETVAATQFAGYRILADAGTEAQKSKYLPDMASGVLIGALCMCDADSGADMLSTNTKAELEEENGMYRLNGVKTWVTNANLAQLYTVFANIKKRNDYGEIVPHLSILLVERSFPGVSIGQRHATAGLRGLDVSTVHFKDTPVPKENLIGCIGEASDIYRRTLPQCRHLTAIRICSALRKLLNATITHSLERKQFGVKLADFDLLQYRIGHMSAAIYALEAMVYMTTGLMDAQKLCDVGLEATVAKVYALNAAKMVTEGCVSILGKKAYSKNEFHALICDLEAYILWEGTTDMLKNYISMIGLIYFAESNQNGILKSRNPLLYPEFGLRSLLRKVQAGGLKKPKLRHLLADHVHPSLNQCAERIEYCVLRFESSVKQVMVIHGVNAQRAEMSLKRLADMVVDLYAVICAMSRANRAYCDGLGHAEHDMRMIFGLTQELDKTNLDLAQIVSNFDYEGYDQHFKTVGKYAIEKNLYFPDHPTAKNVF